MSSNLPDSKQLKTAMEIYIVAAFGPEALGEKRNLFPDDDIDISEWLMGDAVERNDPQADYADVQRFAIRLGNKIYPHMKLVLTRRQLKSADISVWIYSVDTHDLVLRARADNESEQKQIEELKCYNSGLKKEIEKSWAASGIMTEHEFVRQQLKASR